MVDLTSPWQEIPPPGRKFMMWGTPPLEASGMEDGEREQLKQLLDPDLNSYGFGSELIRYAGTAKSQV